jgi:hypothetical protein
MPDTETKACDSTSLAFGFIAMVLVVGQVHEGTEPPFFAPAASRTHNVCMAARYAAAGDFSINEEMQVWALRPVM